MITVNAELHCHTWFSDGFSTPLQAIRQAKKKGLQVLAITDHNSAEGGLPFWKESLVDDVLVIPGEEVSTEIGHVLAYFVRETIPAGPFNKVIHEIHCQGGLAFVAHPYHIPIGNRWRKRNTIKVSEQHRNLVDGIEIENGHNRSGANRLAGSISCQWGINAVSGSDAHFAFEIGNVISQINCERVSLESIKEAMSLGRISNSMRRFNAYPVYLFIGLLNKLMNKDYSYK